MNVKPDPKVLEEASRWHARLAAVDCTPFEREAFAAWVRNPAHARAIASAVKIDQLLSKSTHHPKLQALAALALAEEIPATPTVAVPGAMPKPLPRHARWTVPASLAAGLALCVSIGTVMQDPAPTLPLVSSYETSSDQRQTFFLEDGTTVHADVATRLTVRMGDTGREIELHAGRALFSVSHDPGRPFAVSARGTRTVALGTQFQVQHHHDAILITLAEGSVRVSGERFAERWEETLIPGEQIALDSTASAPRRLSVDPNQVTSWSRGRLLFRGTPLAEAVEEINRYALLKVRLADPTLADLNVGGNFIAGDSRPIVSAFAAVLPVTIVERGDELLLFRRNDTGG